MTGTLQSWRGFKSGWRRLKRSYKRQVLTTKIVVVWLTPVVRMEMEIRVKMGRLESCDVIGRPAGINTKLARKNQKFMKLSIVGSQNKFDITQGLDIGTSERN
ncbi:hypothetical protein BCIN_11g01530 [Botrytis cinerea B05.10]|uniref:Uncharacterized protein n=1 Tax=Botryotinia fuckeliana (strain B05.10) TaxID=332648 RepID=A0A384JW59_BOTFB|nr:hypothetical protein BCIN_11g01530 [Botrytis cinerea B05.10]ATZ54825.1 hypothetical protein BCIN_11g01530 [Botrytis cinerea B05.10]